MLCVTWTDSQNSTNALDVYWEPWSLCRISSPLIAGCESSAFCSEILFYLIFKHFVGLCVLIIRFPGTDNRTQTTFSIHVFMYGCRTVILSPARQIDSHTPVTIDPVVAMADIFNLRKNLWFLGIIVLLPVFTVVVIGIRTDFKPPQQPADTEFLMMFIYKPISL